MANARISSLSLHDALPISSVLASQPRELHATEGQLDGGDVVVIDPAGAGLQPRDHAVSPSEIMGEDPGRSEERRVGKEGRSGRWRHLLEEKRLDQPGRPSR